MAKTQAASSMAHDWGITVPADLPLEKLVEVRAGISDGSIGIEFPAGAETHPKAAQWKAELKSQMLAAYDTAISQRRS